MEWSNNEVTSHKKQPKKINKEEKQLENPYFESMNMKIYGILFTQ
jgi:hypothetical protein